MRNGILEIKKILETQKNILSVFTTAGYPHLDSTVDICCDLAQAGVGFIELGIPFSDPIADGEVIQKTSMQALSNGMTLAHVFKDVQAIRKRSSVPLILMGYYNPIFQYGVSDFIAACRDSGVDGLIVPDLPREEYDAYWKEALDDVGISYISLITPQTSEQRIREIDAHASTFIYAVSSSGVTGGSLKNNTQEQYYQYLKNLQLKTPIMIGFGIRDRESFELACQYVSGAIVGSEFLRHLGNAKDIKSYIADFVHGIKVRE